MTNKTNRDKIFYKLRQKLGIDYLLSLDLNILTPREITRIVFYLAGFTKTLISYKFNEALAEVDKCLTSNYLPLPDNPSNIPAYITSCFDFALPITNHLDIGATVRVLRKVFNFQRLPESYIKDI